jgi:hypothetical protein
MGALGHNGRWQRGWMAGIVGALILVIAAGCSAGATRTVTIVAATPTATPTATLMPTPTHTQTFIYSYDSRNAYNVRLNEWGTDQNCFFASDGFHVKPNLACQTPVRNLGNVNVIAQMRQVSGAPTDENGIEVRRSGNPASLYEFDIAANGSWLFKLCIQSFANCRILTSGSSPMILTGIGAVNAVQVSAVGSHFALLVNDRPIGQADDATLAYGDVWLDSDGTSECVFPYLYAVLP